MGIFMVAVTTLAVNSLKKSTKASMRVLSHFSMQDVYAEVPNEKTIEILI